MTRTGEAQEIFHAIDTLRDKIRLRRATLAMSGQIEPEWPLGDESQAINFISERANKAGLTTTQKAQVMNSLRQTLHHSGSPITVAILENQLLDLQSQINDDILNDIMANLNISGAKIKSATNELKIAIDKLNDLNKIFGTISLAINFVAALLGVGVGNFNPLLSIISKLLA
jgi:hypothetical protein